LQARVVRSYGATEVFPPEDADLIVDNAATGATLAANDLVVVDELMQSTTRLYASPQAMESPQRREGIERLVLLLGSVLEARQRVMLEVNVPAERLEHLIAALPCMREPTVSALHRGAGYAVKAAVPRAQLASIIPELKARGGTDIVISATSQIVP
jgi:ATP phosphoribosyltransferase-like protein